MTPEIEKDLERVLLSLVPSDGSSIGNKKLEQQFQKKIRVKKFEKLQYTEDTYWDIRNLLLKKGSIAKGRGRGGSVSIVDVKPPKTLRSTSRKSKGMERELYRPLENTIREFWPNEYGLKDVILEITANQGSKITGGKWTRPDITLISVNSYAFIPSKILEVTSFEVKPLDDFNVAGVFETAAHSAFAHKSYLAIHTSTKANPASQEGYERMPTTRSRTRRVF